MGRSGMPTRRGARRTIRDDPRGGGVRGGRQPAGLHCAQTTRRPSVCGDAASRAATYTSRDELIALLHGEWATFYDRRLVTTNGGCPSPSTLPGAAS